MICFIYDVWFAFLLRLSTKFACKNLIDSFFLMNLQRNLTPPYVDDGHLEVVGFRDAWHGLVLLAPKGHGARLAQVNK